MTKEEKNEGASIIGGKYRDRYKGEGDWLKKFIDGQIVSVVTKEVTTKDEDGNETTDTVNTKKTAMDLDKLFELAEANHIEANDRYGDQKDRKNAAGRLRMTLGNMLRAAARKRHGLFDLEGGWAAADADFLEDAPMIQNPDGSKIEQPKKGTENTETA